MTSNPPIKTYIDTGVLITAFCGNSIIALKAIEYIDDPDREYITSDFLNLELLPKPIHNKQANAVGFYKAFFDGVSEHASHDPKHIEDAFTLACKYGLSCIDAIHATIAISKGVSEFITSEKSTKPFFRIPDSTLKIISIHD